MEERYARMSAEGKAEILALVKQSGLPRSRALAQLRLPRSTYYRWLKRLSEGRLKDKKGDSPMKPCMSEAKGIFAAPSRREAIRRFKTRKEKWQVEAEPAVRCMEKDLYHYLHYYAFPKELWKKIRTTDMLERNFREVRRRTRLMGVFPNEESADRIFYGITNGILNNGYHSLPVISAEKLT
jgi:transposase-like protein